MGSTRGTTFGLGDHDGLLLDLSLLALGRLSRCVYAQGSFVVLPMLSALFASFDLSLGLGAKISPDLKVGRSKCCCCFLRARAIKATPVLASFLSQTKLSTCNLTALTSQLYTLLYTLTFTTDQHACHCLQRPSLVSRLLSLALDKS